MSSLGSSSVTGIHKQMSRDVTCKTQGTNKCGMTVSSTWHFGWKYICESLRICMDPFEMALPRCLCHKKFPSAGKTKPLQKMEVFVDANHTVYDANHCEQSLVKLNRKLTWQLNSTKERSRCERKLLIGI